LNVKIRTEALEAALALPGAPGARTLSNLPET
jgi:hypothetical protein